MNASPAKRTIAVCIATYQRPTLLRRLLEALLLVKRPDGCVVEVRVVDNARAGSAAAAVDDFAVRCDRDVGARFAVEHRPGVSAVRNTAIDLGPAELVAFIDDDEWPTPTWLIDLVKALDDANADAVIGPVVADLPDVGPAWRRPRFRGAPCSSAGPVPWVAGRTGNVLLRGAWFYERGFRFDEAFSLSGGEDADFFSRIDEAGALIVSSTAVVYESVEAHRLSLRWLLARQRQHGMNYERIRSRRRDARPALLRSTAHIGQLAVMAARVTASQLIQRRLDDGHCLDVALRAAWVAGMVRAQLRLPSSHLYGHRDSTPMDT